MPVAKKPAVADREVVSLTSAKVKKLLIKNFRCVGPAAVEIELDDIVVLVGPNNAGKSTILRAYEVVMLHGSAGGKLKLEDFPGEVIDGNNLPEIELQTYIFDDKPGEQWLHLDTESNAQYVRERWIWSQPDSDPKRQGHRNNAADWDEKVPWGAPNIGNTSAASIPLATHRLLKEHPELSGGLSLQIGFGAGLVYGAQVVRLP